MEAPKVHKWKLPEYGKLKINVDAAVPTNENQFSIGMILRDSAIVFIQGKTMKFAGKSLVFKAEAIGVLEALSWVDSLNIQNVQVETDSLLTAAAIKNSKSNLLEVGNVIDECKVRLQERGNISIAHIRKQTNKVAHMLAHIPCSVGCSIAFNSHPRFLLETLLL